MAIKPFSRIENYFDSFPKLRADSLDKQFNLISDYLNKEIVPTLNTLASDKIPGSINPADVNKFLMNVGDLTTKWSVIDNDSFAVNSLSLTKLYKSNVGSIISADSNRIFQSISPTADNQVITSRIEHFPIWKKLTGDNIQDRSITAASVADGTITNANLPAYLIETLIANNSITGDKFKNNSITSTKIADSTLTVAKLAPALAADFASGVWSNIIPTGYLKTVNDILRPAYRITVDYNQIIRVFNDKSKPVLNNTNGKPTINTAFPASKFSNDGVNRWGFSAYHVHGKVAANKKLKERSIEANRVALVYKPSASAYPNDFRASVRQPIHKMVANGAVELKHLTPYLRQKLEAAR